MAGYFHQRPVTVTATVTDVSTLYTRSVSYVTRTVHFGIERATPMCSDTSLLRPTLSADSAHILPASGMVEDYLRRVDSVTIGIIATALVASFLLGGLVYAHIKEQMRTILPNGSNRPPVQKITSLCMRDDCKVKAERIAGLQILMASLQGDLVSSRSRTWRTLSELKRRSKKAAMTMNILRAARHQLDTSRLHVQDLKSRLINNTVKAQRQLDALHRTVNVEKDATQQRHMATLLELHTQYGYHVGNASEFKRYHAQKSLRIDIRIQRNDIRRHKQVEQTLKDELQYEVGTLKNEIKHQKKVIRRLRRKLKENVQLSDGNQVSTTARMDNPQTNESEVASKSEELPQRDGGKHQLYFQNYRDVPAMESDDDGEEL